MQSYNKKTDMTFASPSMMPQNPYMPQPTMPSMTSQNPYMPQPTMPNMMPQDPYIPQPTMPNMMPQNMPNMMPQNMPNMMPQNMPNMIPPQDPSMMPQAMPNMIPPQDPSMMPQAMPNMMMPNQSQMPGVQKDMAGMEPYTYPQNFLGALKTIQEAVMGETEDKLFYQYLIDNAPSEEDKEIIKGIRDDEIIHFNLFNQLYFQLTGKTLPPPQNVPFKKPASYCDGIKESILGEQNAVKKYRGILFAMQNRVQINILTRIITDEIRHGSLYNYLYAKNGCRK